MFTECHGMKFYDIWDGKVEFGTELWFVMGALHPKDPNYVEVTVKRHQQHCKLGHVKATLLSGCLHCLPDHLQSRGKQYD